MQKVCNIAKGLFAAAALIFLFAKNEILEKTAEGGTTGKVYGRVKRRIAVICVATFWQAMSIFGQFALPDGHLSVNYPRLKKQSRGIFYICFYHGSRRP